LLLLMLSKRIFLLKNLQMDLRNLLPKHLLLANYPGAFIKLKSDIIEQFGRLYIPDNIKYVDKNGQLKVTGQKNLEDSLLSGSFASMPIYASPLITADGAFEGGGAKAIAYLGGLHAMAHCGVWFCRVAGTSGGSLIAALVAAGYKVDLNYKINTLVTEPITAPLEASEHNSLNNILFEEDFSNVADFAIGDDPPRRRSASSVLLRNVMMEVITKIPGLGGVLDQIRNYNISVTSDDVKGPLLQKFPILQPVIDSASDYVASIINGFLRKFSDGIRGIADSFDDAIASSAEDALEYLLYDQAIRSKHRRILRALFRVIEKGGFWTGDVVQALLEKHLQAKIKSPTGPESRIGVTRFNTVAFRDLPIDFCCTATDVGSLDKRFDEDYVNQSKDQIVYFSKKLTPDYSVAEAVRRSISLPVVFYPKKINEGNGFNFPTRVMNFRRFDKNEFLKNPVSRSNRHIKAASYDMSRHNDHILLDGGFRVNLPVSIFRSEDNIVFENNFDSNGKPRNFLFSFNLSDLDELPQRPDAVPRKTEPQPLSSIKSFVDDIIDGTSSIFNDASGGGTRLDINTDGIKRLAKSLQQTFDYTGGNRQELEIIDLLALLPKVLPVNIPAKDPNAKNGDDRFSGEAFGMPNIEKKWIAHSAWEAMNEALKSFTINGFTLGIPSAVKPYKHGLAITVQTPLTGTLQNSPASFMDRYFSDQNYTLIMSNNINLNSGLKILGQKVGNKYYGPGTFWIKTKNSDKTNSADNYLRFEVDNPVRVYLILDAMYAQSRQNRLRLPDFIRHGGWTDTEVQLSSNDPNMQISVAQLANNLFVMHKDFSKGVVTLGGARSGNGRDNRCNYTVLVVQKN
jgi:predicted acylesterase/phospholipase RssA